MFKYILALSTLSLVAHSESLDEALAKTKAKYELKADKKAKRDSIKAKYKTEISALREEQKAELSKVK